MKVIGQKNVYFIDLNKNIYRGYIETSLTREPNDRFVMYKSTHLEIESAQIIGHQEDLSLEFLNTKSWKEKQKNTKNSKCSVAIKSKTPYSHENTSQVELSSTMKILNSEDPQQNNTEVSFETRYSKELTPCYDSFRLRIPDGIESTEFKIRIVFKPVPGNPSILWYKPVHEKDKHKEIIACNTYRNSSCIAPYIDSITDMEMYYVIPNTEEIKVVSSGTFKAIKEEDKTIIYHYSSFCHPKYFMFVVGTYEQTDIFNDSDKRKLLVPFCFDNDTSEVLNDLQAIIKYIENFTKTTDLSTANIVFTVINTDSIVAKNMIVLRYNLIHGPRDIETSFLMKKILCDCLSQQVYGFLGWGVYDSWIYYGFSGYLSDYCIRYLLGNNEFMYNYKEDKDYVLKNDIVEPPLFYTFRKEYDYFSEFFRRKAKMVFHCMEAQLSFSFLQKISDSVLEARTVKLNTSNSNTNEGQKDTAIDLKKCFTSEFIKIVKDSTGKDLKLFFDFYVFRPGLIRVKLSFQINKKKNIVKVLASQTPTSLLPGANKKVQNNIEIKSIELEGIFNHSLAPEGENAFSYHTRTKKKKKEDEEDVMPLLYIRVDPKRETLFDYIVEQPDYMHIEQLQEKNIIGQLEAIESLKTKPTLNTCEALERMLDNSHVFYKIRIRIIYILKSIKIENYDGLQRLIQYFVRTRCVSNSTVLKSNEFGLISYFIQKHLVKGIASIDLKHPNILENSKIVLAFLENILKFNDNSLSQFEDSWYISSVINLFGLHTALISPYKESYSEKIEFSMNEAFKGTEDFLKPTVSAQSTRKSVQPRAQVDISSSIEKCVDETERFRISDMVFPSNNNAITQSCLLSYIRLAFYNKVLVSRQSLESLAQYPNLFSIRLIAIEGLLILFSKSINFVLNVAAKDTSFMVQSILNTILKMVLLRLNTHFLDSDEFDVDLTKSLRKDLLEHAGLLFDIYRTHFFNLSITYAIKRIFVCLEDKLVTPSEFKDIYIKRYDVVKEETSRISLLKTVTISRKVKVFDLEALRIAAFENDHTIRICKAKNIKAKKEVSLKSLKIRIRPGIFLIKHIGDCLIKLRLLQRQIKLSRSELPLFLISRFRDNAHSLQIDDFIKRTKSTGFFDWEPLSSKQILDMVNQNLLTYSQVFQEIEKILIFTLSYNTVQAKLYSIAKGMYSSIESTYNRYSFIPEKISPMTPELRMQCNTFLQALKSNPLYNVFLNPVDFSELRNYLDIVRVPVCFEDISIEKYDSFDAFITSLRRIPLNCLNYNDSRSVIAQNAKQLQKDIDIFCGPLNLSLVNAFAVIKEIISFAGLDTKDLNIANMNSWGDLEEWLDSIRRKHSRYSAMGKQYHNAIKLVKARLYSWFLNDGSRCQIVLN